MRTIAYVLITIAVGGLLYLGSTYFSTATYNSQSYAEYGVYNSTVVGITPGGGGIRFCRTCPIDTNTTTITLSPIGHEQPDVLVHGTCGIMLGQTVTYTFSQAPMIVLIRPSGCLVEVTGWQSI